MYTLIGIVALCGLTLWAWWAIRGTLDVRVSIVIVPMLLAALCAWIYNVNSAGVLALEMCSVVTCFEISLGVHRNLPWSARRALALPAMLVMVGLVVHTVIMYIF